MVARLIKKDLMLIKGSLLPSLIFGLCLFAALSFSFPTGPLSGMGMIAGCLFAEYFLVNALFAVEHKYHGEALMLAAPYTREMVVKSRYLMLILSVAANILLYSLLAAVLTGLFRLEFAPVSFHAVALTLWEAALFIALIVPLYFRFDYLKARPVAMMLLFVLGYGTGFIKYLGDEFSLAWLEKQAAADLVFLVLGGGVLLAALCLTLRIYERKEF